MSAKVFVLLHKMDEITNPELKETIFKKKK